MTEIFSYIKKKYQIRLITLTLNRKSVCEQTFHLLGQILLSLIR